MLELKNIWVKYGKKAAVRKLSLSVNKGDFVTILGANGAGKTTMLNAISGIVKVKKNEGEIYFKGEKISGWKPGKIASLGIIQIPESRELSGGQQQMLAVARGLMAKPEVLLLDEPSLGLSPLMRQQLAEAIKAIHRERVTLVLMEQNARLGLMLASYGYVLENGEMSLQGKTSDLLKNEDVKKAYFGV